MANTNSHSPSRIIILGTTLLLGLAALVLIFAPVEVASGLGFLDLRPAALVMELYGAALFGLAMTGWMVKDSVVGGIFGRSYVVGNASHAVVGAFALVRAVSASATPALMALCALYCLLAIVFGYLMFAASPTA